LIAWRSRGCSAALVDIADQQAGRFGAPQAGGAEQVKQRQVPPALAGAPVGHPQQQGPFVMGERPRLTAADAL